MWSSLARTRPALRPQFVRPLCAGSVLEQARARQLEALRPQLDFAGWQKDEEAVAVKAAVSAQKVLALSEAELHSLASKLASQPRPAPAPRPTPPPRPTPAPRPSTA